MTCLISQDPIRWKWCAFWCNHTHTHDGGECWIFNFLFFKWVLGIQSSWSHLVSYSFCLCFYQFCRPMSHIETTVFSSLLFIKVLSFSFTSCNPLHHGAITALLGRKQFLKKWFQFLHSSENNLKLFCTNIKTHWEWAITNYKEGSKIHFSTFSVFGMNNCYVNSWVERREVLHD